MNVTMKSLSLPFVALAALGLSFAATPATAASTEVTIISIEPMTTKGCMQAAEELRERAKSVADTGLVVAHADEAEEACRQEDFAMASDALSDGYRWLRRKRSKGL